MVRGAVEADVVVGGMGQPVGELLPVRYQKGGVEQARRIAWRRGDVVAG